MSDRTIQQHPVVHVGSVSRTGPSGGDLTNMPNSASNPQTAFSLEPALELNPQTSLSHPTKSALDSSPDRLFHDRYKLGSSRHVYEFLGVFVVETS